jgi:hypothetical protein
MKRRRTSPIIRGALAPLAFFTALGWIGAAAQPTETKVIASDAALGDRFGSGVAISGAYALIGAQADDDLGGDAGAAYIFDLSSATEIRKIHASDGAGGDYFGVEVAPWGDRALIGALRDDHAATDAGSAYIFDLADGTELHKLVASDAAVDDWFGCAVALSDAYALVGAYKYNQSTTIYDSGAAYLFDAATGAQIRKLTASDAGKQDWYGYAVAVSDAYAVVGAPNWDGIGTTRTDCGAVYVYAAATGQELWKLTTVDQGGYDRFGNALAIQGDLLLVGCYWDSNDGGGDAGAAYLFDLVTGEQLLEIFAAAPEGGGDWFGAAVALLDGYAVIGAPQQGYGTEPEGFACVVDLATGQEVERLDASDGYLDDNFGAAVAIQGSVALVAADMNDDNGTNSGSAYFYEPVTPATGAAEGVVPRSLALQNRPNPFNPTTEILLTLPFDGPVRLEVWDARGRHVRTLLPGERLPAGEVRATWDGTDERDAPVPSGVYFYRAEAKNLRAAGKMILIK